MKKLLIITLLFIGCGKSIDQSPLVFPSIEQVPKNPVPQSMSDTIKLSVNLVRNFQSPTTWGVLVYSSRTVADTIGIYVSWYDGLSLHIDSVKLVNRNQELFRTNKFCNFDPPRIKNVDSIKCNNVKYKFELNTTKSLIL